MFFQPLIYAFIFVGIFMMVEGIYLIIYGPTLKREKKVNRRLALMQGGKDTEEVLSILRLEREGAEKHERMPVLGPLVEMARHAAITISILQIVISLLDDVFFDSGGRNHAITLGRPLTETASRHAAF